MGWAMRRGYLIVVAAGGLLAAVVFLWLLLTGGGRTEQDDYRSGYPPHRLPAAKVVADDRPLFRINPEVPYRIEFGRGSGMDGLETIKISSDGRVVLHRRKVERREKITEVSWQSTELQLPKDSLASVLAAVEANKLMTLARAYHATVADGTQWVLWIKQGEREKSVYFDNHFPEPILAFAAHLDEVLTASGRNLTWRPVPWDRSHDKDLWDSIR